jgi:hypothetical protein
MNPPTATGSTTSAVPNTAILERFIRRLLGDLSPTRRLRELERADTAAGELVVQMKIVSRPAMRDIRFDANLGSRRISFQTALSFEATIARMKPLAGSALAMP